MLLYSYRFNYLCDYSNDLPFGIRHLTVFITVFNKILFMLKSILIAGTGGFIGTVLRFLVSRYFQENTFSLFPWGTFTVNIVGSLLIGIFYGMSERGNLLSPDVRIFLTVGICGGFTTFSSLSNDAFILLQEKEWLKLSLYASLSFFLGLVAVYLGRTLIKSI